MIKPFLSLILIFLWNPFQSDFLFHVAHDLENNISRAEIIKNYKAEFQDSSLTDIEWNGSVKNCDPGFLSKKINDRVLQRVNYLRSMVHLDPVVFDEELNKNCQAAALMMKANNQLSHNPPRSWKCFSQEGAEAAFRSNLTLAAHTLEGIMSQFRDDGISNYSVGHRRYILRPEASVFGHGSTDYTTALWVIGNSDMSNNIPEYVPWPPEGFVPSPLVFPRWSFSMKNANFNDAEVTMMDEDSIDVALAVEGVKDGYGDPTIVWVPDGIQYFASEDVAYTVEIKNVKVKGKVKNFKYKVTIVQPE